MKKAAFIGLIVVAAFALLAMAGGSRAFSQDLEARIRAIDEQQRKIQAVIADFSQRKDTALTREPLRSSGQVKFKRPDRVHWIYSKPERFEMALDGKYVWMYRPGSVKPEIERFSLERSKKSAQFLEPLTALFQLPFASVAEKYTVVQEEDGGPGLYHFRLQPKDLAIQKFLSRVDLWIDKTSGAILRFKMLEINGDRLTLEFKNIRINPPLADEDLKIKTPPATKVHEQSWP